MLLCAGCGEAFSEWAAHCPACGRDAGDAHEQSLAGDTHTVDSDSESGTDGSDTGDDKPPTAPVEHRLPVTRKSRRLLVTVISLTMVVVAGIVVAVSRIDRPTKAAASANPLPGAVRHLPGRLLLLTSSGTIETTDADGQDPHLLPGLGTFESPTAGTVAVSDQRLVAIITQGRLMAVFTNQPNPAALPLKLTPPIDVSNGNAFADGDTATVTIKPTDTGSATALSALTFEHSTTVPLGIDGSESADDVAGDPQSLGAFVSVAAATQPANAPPGGIAGLIDTRLELRHPDQPATVIATAGQLSRDAGQDSNPAAHLAVYPSPDGNRLAVVLDPNGAGQSDAPMVIVSRTGQAINYVPAEEGPMEYSGPAWSPDGKTLAYITYGSQGASLATWTPGHSPTVRVTPDPDLSYSGCLWSPQDRDILCIPSQSDDSGWIVADARNGPVYLIRSAGVPIAWSNVTVKASS